MGTAEYVNIAMLYQHQCGEEDPQDQVLKYLNSGTLCNACGVKWKHGKILQDTPGFITKRKFSDKKRNEERNVEDKKKRRKKRRKIVFATDEDSQISDTDVSLDKKISLRA